MPAGYPHGCRYASDIIRQCTHQIQSGKAPNTNRRCQLQAMGHVEVARGGAFILLRLHDKLHTCGLPGAIATLSKVLAEYEATQRVPCCE